MDDVTEADRLLVICVRETDSHTDESVLKTGACGHKVWLSESGQQFYAEHEAAQFICMGCAPEYAKDEELRPIPGSLEEIEPLVGEEGVEDIKEVLRQHNERVRKRKNRDS